MTVLAGGADPAQSQPLARFKDLCIDAVDVALMARFWADALGLQTHSDGDQLRLGGPTNAHTVWINAVPEARTAKNRLHLDVHGAQGESEAELIAAGSVVVERLPHWTVMADPEGGEFCLFERADPPAYRLYEVVLDATDARATAMWWAAAFGTEAQCEDRDDWYWLAVPGAPFESLVVNPVPEAKTTKNRLHLDVTTTDPGALVAAGASVLRAADAGIGWHVLRDPEGNEFCAFDVDRP